MFTMYFFYNLDSKINSEKVLMQQSSGGFTNEDIGEIKSLFHGSLRRVNFYEHVIYLGEVEFENEKDYSDNINVVLNGLINQKNIQKTIYEFNNNITCVLDDKPICDFEGDFETCENTEECEWDCEMPNRTLYLFRKQKQGEDFTVYEFSDFDILKIDKENSTVLVKKWDGGFSKYEYMTNLEYLGSYETKDCLSNESREKVIKMTMEA